MAAQPHENNFDFLRFFAASLVVFSHCFPLLGRSYEPLARACGFETLGGLAVCIFFIISGYLVAASWDKNRNPGTYLRNRLLRIYPGYAASILVCALIVGPLFTTLPTAEYFNHPDFAAFLKNFRLYGPNFTLPGTFEHHPNHGVAGTYWTLPMEFTMYLAILALGMTRRLTVRTVLPLAAACYGLHLWTSIEHGLSLPLGIQSGSILRIKFYFFTIYAGLFLHGTLFYLLRDKIIYHSGLFWLLCALVTASFHRPEGHLIMMLALPYLVLFLALSPKIHLPKAAQYGDMSYGIYLYGFPAQQIVIHFWGTELSIAALFSLSMLLSLACALASWHGVEAVFLRRKRAATAAPSRQKIEA